jgi:acetyl-CoA carboxylase beta subunit
MPLELYCPQCGGQVDASSLHTEQAICPSCGEREAIRAYINYRRIHQLVTDGQVTNMNDSSDG